MDENLKRLVEEFRRETCPQRVLDEIAGRLQRNVRPRLRFEVAATVTALVVFGAFALWRWPAGRDPHGQPNAGPPLAVDSAQAARQAEMALGCLGAALRDVGARSEEVILKVAVPPLRNSLQTARNKIVNHI